MKSGRRIGARTRFVRGCIGIAVAFLSGPILAAPQCTLATGAQLGFGNVVALESSGDKTTDSGASFWINCNAEVAAPPQLYSSSPRMMLSGANQLPFKLSLVSADSGDLPASPPGTALAIARNGASQTVRLYGKIRASDFKSLPGGVYSTSISLTIEY